VDDLRARTRPVEAIRLSLAQLVEDEGEVLDVQRFLAGVVLGTKAVLTRVELGGTLLLAAVIGPLLTLREVGNEPS
jgi:hypothetical protein